MVLVPDSNLSYIFCVPSNRKSFASETTELRSNNCGCELSPFFPLNFFYIFLISLIYFDAFLMFSDDCASPKERGAGQSTGQEGVAPAVGEIQG